LLIVTADAQQAKPVAPDRNAFTIVNWNLDATIETENDGLSARGKITLRNDSPQPQPQITVQISSSLKWASIGQDGKPLPFTASSLRSDIDHTGQVNEAVVTLPNSVAPGASINLEVGYSGTVSLDTTRLAQIGMPLAVRAGTDYDRITPTFTCLRGMGHVIWFPVSVEPSILGEGNRIFESTGAWQVRHSLSGMTLGLSIDNNSPVLSNAQMTSREQLAGSSHWTHTWKHLGVAGPIIVSGTYEAVVARDTPRNAPFTVEYFAANALAAQDYARVIHDTTPMVTGSSALPIHFVDLPEPSDSSFDGDGVFLTPLKTVDRKSLELTVAYQLAHQTLWSPRAWIYEGAAHFAQALMRERQDGRAAAIAFMAQRLPPLALVDSAATEMVKSNSLVNTKSEVFYRTKAMYVWWMLREIVGQAAVLDALQQYDPTADKEPSYVQRLLEKASHKDLEWFFDDWIYQDRGLPEFTISNGYARPSLQGIFLVSATIENTGAASAEVPVIVRTANGDVLTRQRVPAKGKVAVRVEVGSRPTEVVVNDGSVPEADRSDNTTPVKIGHP
jgi:hypothetical protein